MSWVIEKTLELDAPRQRVWAAITDPRELEQWFPDRADFSPVVGAKGVLEWHGHGAGKVEVLEVAPPERLVWRWSGNDGRALEEYGTTVEWTLSERPDGGTTLHLRESGFDTQKHFEENSGGWRSELGELVQYLAGG